MSLFKRNNRKSDEKLVQTAGRNYSASLGMFLNKGNIRAEHRLYKSLRENVPVIDAAVCKLVRLAGGFVIKCGDKDKEDDINYFLRNVNVNGLQSGIDSFLSIFLDQLITYGTAIGEIVLDKTGTNIAALYNASLDDVELGMGDNPLDIRIISCDSQGNRCEVKYPSLVICGTILNEPGRIYGNSVLRGLPFVCDIIGKIFTAIGTNWDRVGNVRFAVSYKPSESDRSFSKERAQQIASEWSKAMNSTQPRDFVSVGDVSVSVIGADNQIPDSQVPVRLLLEQIVSKLSVPPFLLGLSWSSTERMSAQQADILTSELEYYRKRMEPCIRHICDMYLKLNGKMCSYSIEWDNINLQDEVELAKAKLLNAQAENLITERN